MGTPQYMAPEQLQGKPADARSDLFAFGCVLYELLSGKMAFSGDNVATLISAILEREPEPLDVPAPLDRVIRTSLAKDPDQRFQTATDLKRSLTWAMEQPPGPLSPVIAPKANHYWPWVLTACLAVSIAAGIFALRKPGDPLAQLKFDVTPPPASTFVVGAIGGSAISPGGRMLAFVAKNAKGEFLLHLRPIDSLEARALPGTEKAGPSGRPIASRSALLPAANSSASTWPGPSSACGILA